MDERALPRRPSAPLVGLRERRESREVTERHGLRRRSRRDRDRDRAAALDEAASAQGDAPLSLAPAGAEPGVALQRLDVRVSAGDRVVEIVQRHVLAAADERLGHGAAPERYAPSYSQRDSQVSQTATRTRSGSFALTRTQIQRARISLVGFSR